MNWVDRITSTYYESRVDLALEEVDIDLLRNASVHHREIIQNVWDGGIPEQPAIVYQPSVKHFRRNDPNDEASGFVYQDALGEQLKAIEERLREGYLVIPMVLCDFNTLPVSALFGADVVEDYGLYIKPRYSTRKELESISKPDVESGLPVIMNRVSARLRRELPSWIDVGVRLNTGPLSVAAELRGTTDLIYDMLEARDLYHHFMSVITQNKRLAG